MAKKKTRKKETAAQPSWMVRYAGAFVITAAALLPVFVFFAFVFAVGQTSQETVLAHTYVGTVDVSGLTFEEAKTAVQDRINEIHDAGIILSFRGEQFTIETTLTDPANSEISYPLVTYNVQETIKKLRASQATLRPAERAVQSLFVDVVAPAADIDADVLKEVLTKELAEYETPAQNARIAFAGDSASLLEEQHGLAFDYDALVTHLVSQLALLITPRQEVELEVDEPSITLAEVADMTQQVEEIATTAPYEVAYNGDVWPLEKDDVKSWAMFYRREVPGTNGKTEDGQVLGAFEEISVGLSPEGMEEYLEEVAAEINIDAREAKFEMKNGKVTEFQPSRNGLTLNIPASIEAVNVMLANGGTESVELVVDEAMPAVSTEDVNSIGITELVAVGQTNFSGSPKNRRYNIGLAADKLNGTLIAPGETFSLVEALSPIDKANGYLPELVIKGNRTIPEVGGGLCQIGTTFFRVVLDAGLPVVERRNHSYRVSYYEPPVGMDATIYDPKPDFRFTNDYPGHLLLQSYVDGDELIFEFYGTKDGRTASTTDPRIYNVVRPGPTKLIETTDLVPGERKCIEHAHNGADADFTYTVTYPDGTVKNETFTSHYKAWPEVCLVGVTQVSDDTEQADIENAQKAE